MDHATWTPQIAAMRQRGVNKADALWHELREAVRSGRLAPGTRLPPVRMLADALGVTPGTVARAYQLAARDGIIDSHVGRGSFVRAAAAPAPTLQPMLTDYPVTGPDAPVDLRVPHLPDIGQEAAIRDAMVAAAGRMDGRLLNYPALDGDWSCRLALARFLTAGQSRVRMGRFDPAEMVLTLGGQNALAIVVGLLLQSSQGARPVVMTEAYSYPGIGHVVRMARATQMPVAMDAEGLIPEALDRTARESGARLLIVSPNAQNPTAACMGPARRAAIVEIARHRDLQLIEDDCILPLFVPSDPASGAGSAPEPERRGGAQARPGDDRAEVQALRDLAPERVWHVSSLSKAISPALRVGALSCPPGMGRVGRLAAQHRFFALPLPLTEMVLAMAERGVLTELGSKVAAVQAERLSLARSILPVPGLGWQPGLPFLWLPLPQGLRATEFVRRAAQAGVLLRAGQDFALPSPPAGHMSAGALAGQGGAPVPSGRRAPSAGRREGEFVRLALDSARPAEQLAAALGRLAGLLSV